MHHLPVAIKNHSSQITTRAMEADKNTPAKQIETQQKPCQNSQSRSGAT